MRLGFDGLIGLAKSKKVNPGDLRAQESLVFINRAKDKVKILASNCVVSYLRFTDLNRPLDLDTLNEFPRAFSPSGTLDYDKALRLTLEKKLTQKKFSRLELLRSEGVRERPFRPRLNIAAEAGKLV